MISYFLNACLPKKPPSAPNAPPIAVLIEVSEITAIVIDGLRARAKGTPGQSPREALMERKTNESTKPKMKPRLMLAAIISVTSGVMYSMVRRKPSRLVYNPKIIPNVNRIVPRITAYGSLLSKNYST